MPLRVLQSTSPPPESLQGDTLRDQGAGASHSALAVGLGQVTLLCLRFSYITVTCLGTWNVCVGLHGGCISLRPPTPGRGVYAEGPTKGLTRLRGLRTRPAPGALLHAAVWPVVQGYLSWASPPPPPAGSSGSAAAPSCPQLPRAGPASGMSVLCVLLWTSSMPVPSTFLPCPQPTPCPQASHAGRGTSPCPTSCVACWPFCSSCHRQLHRRIVCFNTHWHRLH